VPFVDFADDIDRVVVGDSLGAIVVGAHAASVSSPPTRSSAPKISGRTRKSEVVEEAVSVMTGSKRDRKERR